MFFRHLHAHLSFLRQGCSAGRHSIPALKSNVKRAWAAPKGAFWSQQLTLWRLTETQSGRNYWTSNPSNGSATTTVLPAHAHVTGLFPDRVCPSRAQLLLCCPKRAKTAVPDQTRPAVLCVQPQCRSKSDSDAAAKSRFVVAPQGVVVVGLGSPAPLGAVGIQSTRVFVQTVSSFLSSSCFAFEISGRICCGQSQSTDPTGKLQS